MRLLYIADGRSPIALNWINHFIQKGDEVHLATSFPCQAIDGLASLTVITVAMSGLYGQPASRDRGGRKLLRNWLPTTWRTQLRQFVAPATFPKATRTLVSLGEQIRPDLMHAMRIPYEGMIASEAKKQWLVEGDDLKGIPLIISVWGNDFTLHARSTLRMSAYTRQALQYCDGLHTDCQRDQRLAIKLGYVGSKPHMVIPGGGGVKVDIFSPGGNEQPADEKAMVIINPRGFRAYVRNDTFFHAIPMVIEKYGQVRFVCPGMSDEAQAHKWVTELGIGDKVELLPRQSPQQMAEQFRRAEISLSITTHDGTPNTLLEAMACGCFPIAGDIESLREWITPGVNGLLVDPYKPEGLAQAIIEAISQKELRRSAREKNLSLVKERAEYGKCMRRAEEFYQQVISNQPS